MRLGWLLNNPQKDRPAEYVMANDVRALGNFVLEHAQSSGVGVSNLALNKIVYFLHEAFLLYFRKPLVSAKIEAWDHGPVFREIYHQFKVCGRDAITFRSTKIDPLTGVRVAPALYLSEAEEQFVSARCRELLRIPPGRLVDMSHVSGGPWHQARFGNGGINPGVQITDEMIYKFGR